MSPITIGSKRVRTSPNWRQAFGAVIALAIIVVGYALWPSSASAAYRFGPVSDGDGALTPTGGLTPGSTESGDESEPVYAAVSARSFIVAGKSSDGAACGTADRTGNPSVPAAASVVAGEPVTYCFLVSNLGSARVDRIRLTDAALSLADAPVPSVGADAVVEPGAHLMLFHAADAVARTKADATVVTARPIDANGAPIAGLAVATVETAPGPIAPAPASEVAVKEPAAEKPAVDEPVDTSPTASAPAAADAPAAGASTTGELEVTAVSPNPSTAGRPTNEVASGVDQAATKERADTAALAAAAGATTQSVDVQPKAVDVPKRDAKPADLPAPAATAERSLTAAADSEIQSELAFTGPATDSWAMAVFGSGLIFFGYTFVVAYRRPRHGSGRVGHAQLDVLGFDRTGPSGGSGRRQQESRPTDWRKTRSLSVSITRTLSRYRSRCIEAWDGRKNISDSTPRTSAR